MFCKRMMKREEQIFYEEKNMNSTNVNDLIALLKGHRVYLQTHNFPDPDAIASAFGLQTFLKIHGIESNLCYDGNIDKLSTKRMLTNFELEIIQANDVRDMTETDYIVTIDGQKYNSNFTDLIGDEVACIDHHPTVFEYSYHYKDVRIVGACSSIVTSYFVDTHTPIPPLVASALCYGIKMDTNGFLRGTTPFDVDMFSYAFKQAAVERFNAMFKNVMEFSDLKAYATAIDTIQIYDRSGFAVIPYDCPDALIAIISDFLLSLDVVDISVVYSERKDGLKFSVRSEEEKVDAGKMVAEALKGIGNGGGHKTMAGGLIPKENRIRLGEHYRYDIRQRFIQEIAKQMKEVNPS